MSGFERYAAEADLNRCFRCREFSSSPRFSMVIPDCDSLKPGHLTPTRQGR